MRTGRLEAFSDGVLAIIITIMVLDLHPPREATLAALCRVWQVLLSYIVSFAFVGIYWNNHHHMFQVTQRVSGGILWANLHLLFWLSLIPFVTDWMGGNHFAPTPVAMYGVVLLMAGAAYWVLQRIILASPGNKLLAAAVGHDFKGNISLVLYAVAIPLSYLNRWVACALYVVVALIWLIPDRRMERAMAGSGKVTTE